MSDRVEDLSDRVGDVIESSRESLLQRSWETILRTTSRMRQNASERARFLANERPLQVVAGVAAFAFVAGVMLRIWRSRYE